MEQAVAEVKREALKFGDGLSAPVNGLLYMNQHPGLWRYAVWPTLLNIVISTLVLIWLIVVCIAIIGWRAWGDGDVTWWSVTREVLIAVGMLVLALGLTLAVYWLVQGVLMGHFFSKLAEQVERELGVEPDELGEVSFRFQVIDAAIDTTLLLLVLLGFLVLQLIPVLGTVLGFVGWVYANGYILGRDVMDHPLKLRGRRRAERRAFGRRHRGVVVGIGLVVFALNLVPVAGAMLQTTSVVGAVLLYRQMREGDAAPP